jgi:hypothetical protein
MPADASARDPIAPTTAERLVRVRVLLVAAQAAATDGTPVGRHAAVVALDGVAELAMGLAAHELGVPVAGKGGVPGLLDRLRDALGEAWAQEGVQGVAELHRARNAVQHAGVLPDAAHLPLWTAEVERFVHSLVAATFGAELAAVSAASAVQQLELREPLVEAEQQRDAGEHAASLRSSQRAFKAALAAFRSRRGASPFRFGGASFREFDEFRVIKGTLEALEEFLDVATLAADVGEWLWLGAVIDRSRDRGAAPSRDDAQRGLAFALHWVLRYESFVARYVREPVVEQAPRPSPYEHYERPRITAIEPADIAAWDLESLAFEVTLSPVPPEWDWSLHEASRVLQQGPPPGRARRARFADADDTFVVEVPETSTPAEVLSAVEALIDESHRQYEARLAQRRQIEEEGAAVARRYRDELADHDPDGRTGAVTAELREREGGHRVTVELDLPDDVDTAQLGAAITSGVTQQRPGGHVGVGPGVVVFEASLIPAGELLERVEAAIAVVREREAERKRQRREREARRAALIDGVRDEFERSGGATVR